MFTARYELDLYTGCPRRNVPDFGRMFLMLKYTHITQKTYIQYQISRDIGWVSENNTLLWCKVSQGRRHVSALYYKAIIRSDMVKTKEENYNVTYCLYT